MRAVQLALAAIAGLTLAGCVSTVASVVTAPVRVAGKAVDMATTSQSEADEKRGRNLRKHEEQYGKLDRDYQRHSRQCERGDDEACEAARTDYAQMQDLRSGIPAERD
jgi:hypothetical protein